MPHKSAAAAPKTQGFPGDPFHDPFHGARRGLCGRLREGWPDSLDARFLALLALVRDGTGRRDARILDLLVSARHAPRDNATVLEELAELERRGLVCRGPGGTRYRWAVTDAGAEALGGRLA
jgi:hypothetical protein